MYAFILFLFMVTLSLCVSNGKEIAIMLPLSLTLSAHVTNKGQVEYHAQTLSDKHK